MQINRVVRSAALVGTLFAVAACVKPGDYDGPKSGLNPVYVSKAIHIAEDMRKKGRRVWCVPFARNASGIELRGNAEFWWDKAKGKYDRGHKPIVGAIMAFSDTRRNPMGHLAVVSKIEDERTIRVHHANWKRNRVSLDMKVIDVSKNNDWSRVKVESNPGKFGRVYPIDGFISKPAGMES